LPDFSLLVGETINLANLMSMRNPVVFLMALLLMSGSLPLQAQITETNSFTNLNEAIPDGSASGLRDARRISSAIPKLFTRAVLTRAALTRAALTRAALTRAVLSTCMRAKSKLLKVNQQTAADTRRASRACWTVETARRTVPG
jgi:hypothetical protein